METKQKGCIRRLMELFKKTDRVHLKDTVRMLEISIITIRRDLHREDESLPLTLLGGYIAMVNRPAPSMPVVHDVPKDHRDDLPIAILTVGMVSENGLIFFDDSQEVPLVIGMIPDAITFTGICYLHHVFVVLNERPSVTAMLCGGTYRVRGDVFYDVSSSLPLDSLNPRKILISAGGVHNHSDVS